MAPLCTKGAAITIFVVAAATTAIVIDLPLQLRNRIQKSLFYRKGK